MKLKSDPFKLTLSDGTEVELSFVRPSHDELLQMDLEYRRIYSVALREGVMTGTEAVKRLKDSGGWDDEDDDKLSLALIELTDLEKRVIEHEEGTKHFETDEELAEAVMRLSKLRRTVMDTMTVKTNVFEQTCEGIAEDQKRYKYISLCTMENDERFFENYDHFKSFLSKEKDAGSELYRRGYFFLHDIEDDPSQDWAEVKYLQRKQRELNEQKEQLEKEAAEAQPEEPAEEQEVTESS